MMKKALLIAGVLSIVGEGIWAQSLDKGIKFYNYERYESAMKELSSLKSSKPEANYYYGLAQLGLEDLEGAKTTFSVDPNDFYNQAGMARYYLIKGQKTKAEEELNKIVDKAKKKEWEKYMVAADAVTYTKGGNIQDAIDWYQKALDREPDNAMLYLGQGDCYLKLETGGGEAMNNYEKALEKGGQNSLAYSKIGYLWYVAKNYKSAVESYSKAKEADPNNPLPYRDLAYAYQKAGNYKYALENVENYLQHSDKDDAAKIAYANLLFLSEDYAKALTQMEELVASGNDRADLHRGIAYSAYEIKDYAKAYSELEAFFAKENNTEEHIPNDYLYRGRLYLVKMEEDSANAQSYVEKAEESFNKALEIEVDEPEAKDKLLHKIAESYQEAGQYGPAGKWMGKVIAADADAPALDYFYWGYWTFVGRDYDMAQKAFKAMKAKYPKEGSALYWLARVEAAQDAKAQTGGAVESYEEWLNFEEEGYEKKEDQLMYAYQYLAYYYYNKKNESEALQWSHKILEINSDNEFAQSLIKYFKDLKK